MHTYPEEFKPVVLAITFAIKEKKNYLCHHNEENQLRRGQEEGTPTYKIDPEMPEVTDRWSTL